MKKLFQLNESKNSSRRPLDLILPRVNQACYGLRSIRYEGAKSGTTYQTHLNPLKILILLNVALKPGKVPAAIAVLETCFSKFKFLAV